MMNYVVSMSWFSRRTVYECGTNRVVSGLRRAKVSSTYLKKADPVVFGEADGGKCQVLYSDCLNAECVKR